MIDASKTRITAAECARLGSERLARVGVFGVETAFESTALGGIKLEVKPVLAA